MSEACSASSGAEGLIRALNVPFGPWGSSLLETPSVVLWTRRCPVGAAGSWETERPCYWTFVALPTHPMQVMKERHEPYVADSNCAMFYNRGEVHSRRALTPKGDRSLLISMSDEIAREIVSRRDPAAADRDGGPFPFTHAPLDAQRFLSQWRLAERAREGLLDPLEIECMCVEYVAQQVEHADAFVRTARERSRSRDRRSDTLAAWRDLAERTRELLATAYAQPLDVQEIARRVHSSPYHLLRVFRAHTSWTIHAYRNEIRLREALLRIVAGCEDLSSLAVELGFSSHSHLTTSFRRLFGVPPSAARGSKRLARLATKMEPRTRTSRNLKGRPPSAT